MTKITAAAAAASSKTEAKPTESAKVTNKKIIEAEQKASVAERRAARAEAKIDRLKTVIANDNLVKKQVRGFVDFLREQSVVGLAIGLVLGTQAKALVDQMVKSFFDPMIGLLLPGQGSLNQKSFILTMGIKHATFNWGAFVISLLTFVIVAAVVYYVFKGLRLDKLDKKKADAK
jgi:large conductance mechanosensitive channel